MTDEAPQSPTNVAETLRTIAHDIEQGRIPAEAIIVIPFTGQRLQVLYENASDLELLAVLDLARDIIKRGVRTVSG